MNNVKAKPWDIKIINSPKWYIYTIILYVNLDDKIAMISDSMVGT